jgi:recombination protein RecA
VPAEIDALIAQINKEQKSELLIRGADLLNTTWQRCTTGSLSFDLMLGGGWPLNCINEIIGIESAGKTAMALKTIGANQALDPKHHTLWVAAEEFDHSWAQHLGVDIARMTFVQSNIMEEAYESCLQVMAKRACDAVVIDSLPALVPGDEAEKSMMEFTVGRGALLTNKFMRKSYAAMNRSLTEADRPVMCLVVNQWRDMIGQLYGDPRTTPGGKGKNYRYAVRVEVSRLEWLKHDNRQVGQTIKAQTIKNKTAPPRRTGQVDFYFEDVMGHAPGSYDHVREVWDIAVTHEVIERHGAWYHFDGKKWNGKDAVWTAMQDSQALVDDLDLQVRVFCGVAEPPKPKRSGKRSVKRT